MKKYNLSEARKNFTEVLDSAIGDDVIIERRDGSRFQILPIGGGKKAAEKSPLSEIKCVGVNIPLDVLLSVIKEGRAA